MTTDAPIHDAVPHNWVDRWSPRSWRPYLKLARLDRPIGSWLLFWPCAWGAALGGDPWPDPRHLVLFALGSVVMRGAGCTFNDITDRDIDGKVFRTALRPLASGAVRVSHAWAFLIGQCFLGLMILMSFNDLTIALGIVSLVPVAIYPFMKRVTWWPQAFLGIAFNWGALVGFAAARDRLSPEAVALYLAGIAWTIGYDTIYAHQDRDDDALIGVKSTARLFGPRTREALVIFYAACIGLLGLVGLWGDLHGGYWVGLLAVTSHLTWQIIAFNHDDAALCLHIFRANRLTGGLIFAGLLMSHVL